LKSYINGREIKKEELDEEVMIRLAGMSRVFEGTAGEPAALMELALYPPRRLDEGFGAFGGFSTESASKGCELIVDPSMTNEAFGKGEPISLYGKMSSGTKPHLVLLINIPCYFL
jgi:hypothetical protein